MNEENVFIVPTYWILSVVYCKEKEEKNVEKQRFGRNEKGEKVQEKIEICWKIEMPPKENRKKGIEVTHLLRRGKWFYHFHFPRNINVRCPSHTNTFTHHLLHFFLLFCFLFSLFFRLFITRWNAYGNFFSASCSFIQDLRLFCSNCAISLVQLFQIDENCVQREKISPICL